MGAFTINIRRNRFDVLPFIAGNSKKFKVNVNGEEVFFAHDLDGYLRAAGDRTRASLSLLADIAANIEHYMFHDKCRH
ncbi:hypothetical protein GA0116948_10435 [Chitinophaga costaii]|uniref:Uncharacterized protein n=1 Tax=Chitinophaga costaii TaxID=1335309 RepID=A0A1C4CAN4_9BACT|nr:hypothetical protein [Chitinophaga costaii]SCC16145.1 hypothetical protein GA0116948_10435 [Chitinophaga costaii]